MNEKVYGIQLFLNQAIELFDALKKDIPVKEKLIRDFNFDPQSLEKSFILHAKAQYAETAFETATKDAAEAKTTFEKRCEEAAATFRKYSAFLKVALKNNPQKQLDLGLIGKIEAKATIQWLDNTIQSYDLLLPDRLTIGLMGKYNLKQQDFVNAREMVVSTRDAYEALTKDRPEVKFAIDERDEAVMELVENVSEIQALLLQVFEKDPKQLKKYNLPLVNDEIGREMSILMVKDSSIT